MDSLISPINTPSSYSPNSLNNDSPNEKTYLDDKVSKTFMKNYWKTKKYKIEKEININSNNKNNG